MDAFVGGEAEEDASDVDTDASEFGRKFAASMAA